MSLKKKTNKILFLACFFPKAPGASKPGRMEEIPPKAKQPSTWIQAKLQDWKRENTASIRLSTCLAEKKNLDWMVGVGKGMRMAVQEQGGESRHVLSPLDLHR